MAESMDAAGRALAGTRFIPLSVPEIRGNEWRYVKECLDTNWVSSAGPFVDRFESEVARYLGARHAVATTSGTAALHVALLVAGVRPDDEVLVPTLTFVAPANAVRYVRAWPVFVDVESTSWQMDPTKVWDFLQKECYWRAGVLRNRRTDRRIAALLPAHILGHSCDMDPLREAARRFDLPVIEDASEGLGAVYQGVQVGHLGKVACLSFNGNKIITTGGGGMIVTDDEAWATRARHLTTQAKDDPVEFIHSEIGFNYRLTNVQAALGCAQLEQLPAYIRKKRQLAEEYRSVLNGVPGLTPMLEIPWGFSTFWMYTVLVDANDYGEDSRKLLRRLAGKGIETRPLWQPLHLSPAHSGNQAYFCEVAERLNRDALSLPCSVGLTGEDQREVIEALLEGQRFCVRSAL